MKFYLKLLVVMVAPLFLLASCSNMKSAKMVPDSMVQDLSPQYLAGEVSSKVDGYVLLLDSSLSMNKKYEGYVKFDVAKAFVENLNNTLPPIPADSGLRTFGHAPQVSSNKTELLYGMTEFNREGMNQGVSQVTYPGGPTPMREAIQAAAADLQNIQGKKALIIVSDGEDLDDRPIKAAQEMAAQMGDDICIYTVHVGDDEDGMALMENLAQVTPCGFMVSALDVVPAAQMAGYVSQIFLSGKDTGLGYHEPEKKETGLGYHKPEQIERPLNNVHFKFDDYSVSTEGQRILDNKIKLLSENPDIKLSIEGHTSAKGAEAYNQTLSEKRAASVKDYLVNKGISEDRLTAVGYGETRPKVKEVDPEQADSPAAISNMRVEFNIVE